LENKEDSSPRNGDVLSEVLSNTPVKHFQTQQELELRIVTSAHSGRVYFVLSKIPTGNDINEDCIDRIKLMDEKEDPSQLLTDWSIIIVSDEDTEEFFSVFSSVQDAVIVCNQRLKSIGIVNTSVLVPTDIKASSTAASGNTNKDTNTHHDNNNDR